MRPILSFIFLFTITWCDAQTPVKPDVFVFTDINIAAGDPDDRQSMVHLFWYADELDIRGIVPDRLDRQGMEATLMALEAYAADYERYGFSDKGYPSPAALEEKIATGGADAARRLQEAAMEAEAPLWVLIWGNMNSFKNALQQHPEIAERVRVVSIGTGLKYGPADEVPGEDCTVPNWNGPGRNDIYNDPRFKEMWWLEINWTYNGMFSGEGPREMFEKLSRYGVMGRHIREVVSEHPWAQYFRVGDTPSVLYLIDHSHDPDKPEESSWAGRFKKPFPEERPHYYTDDNGPVVWDFADPCNTWENLEEMYAYNKSTLEKERPEMYRALLDKLESLYAVLEYPSAGDIRIDDLFWGPVLEINRDVTIPHNLQMCEETGAVDNFRKAAGMMEGRYTGLLNWDNFLYKTIEAAAWDLVLNHDGPADTYLDTLIEIIAAAQLEDGYLKTDEILQKRQNPAHVFLDDLQYSLELYSFGHLMEAAAAHHIATGKSSLLNVAVNAAEMVDSLFGQGKRRDVPGHEEIETALVRMFEATGNMRYLDLARFFIDERGNASGHRLMGPFHQDHLPVREQEVAVGQAPRALYLFSGMADVYFHDPESGYLQALEKLWRDVVHRKIYITGGIGSRHENEGFGEPYDLPNATAYCEPCAAISLMMLNTRMFRLRQDAAYFEVFERTLYNNFLAGVSLSGDRFFYACPLESDGEYRFNLGWVPEGAEVPYREASATRKEWFPCACCPPNIARYLAQIPRYIYAVKGDEIFVNLLIGNRAILHTAGGKVRVEMETDIPREGGVKITIPDNEAGEFMLHIRIPHWAGTNPIPGDLYNYSDTLSGSISLTVNGEPMPVNPDRGYLSIRRRWAQGDEIRIGLPVLVRRIEGHPDIRENAGRIALERGPVVYCFEQLDNGADISGIRIPGSVNSSVDLIRIDSRPVQRLIVETTDAAGLPVRATAIPYYAWSNRGPGKMVVWIRQE